MSDKCSHEWINALVCTTCGKVARSSHTYDDVVTCTERICCLQQELAEAQTRIAELEEERVELQDALGEIAEHLYIDAVAARDIAIKANVPGWGLA